jgi:predicted NBD/HSP70 family sugar kinase
MSRPALVGRTGLTRSAIRGLIGELVAGGLVSEGRARPPRHAGPAVPARAPEPQGAVVLAFDIEVDSLAVAGSGSAARPRPRPSRPAARPLQPRGDRRRPRRARLDDPRPTADGGRLIGDEVGVGVAVAGVVRRADGLVSMAPNLGWKDEPLGARLANALGDDVPIAVANEAELGGLAEARRGVARGADHVLFISGEVGVGGGLLVDGRPFAGVAGYGGEVGHFPVNPAGRTCSCGSLGCWETEVGALSLLRRAGRSERGGRLEMDALLRGAAAGEPDALGALEETGRWIGIGLAGLVNVLNPSLVVFGGLFQRVIHSSPRSSRPSWIVGRYRRLDGSSASWRALSEAEAPLIGAAELALEPVLADPSAWLRRSADSSETRKLAVRRVVA